MTTYETRTGWTPEAVIERAERFFAGAGSPSAAFVERRSAGFLKLHQEVAEIYVSALPEGEWTRVRASASRGGSLLARFMASLAPAHDVVRTTHRHGAHRSSACRVEELPAPARPIPGGVEPAVPAAA
jgi:hypothetical protein